MAETRLFRVPWTTANVGPGGATCRIPKHIHGLKGVDSWGQARDDGDGVVVYVNGDPAALDAIQAQSDAKRM